MCGICGFVTRMRDRDATSLEEVAGGMARALHHRGPDGQGMFTDARLGVALAHRRLSIIDLSETGNQPMHSRDGRWVVVFNGEIYDFERVRQRIDAATGGWSWRGSSDTEVLVESIARDGMAAFVQLNGMFACAVLDLRDRQLYLVRDRLGEKPLYYGWQGDAFLFGSELKALVAHPAMQRRLDPGAVASLLGYCYVPAPMSIYSGIAKLPPASIARIALDADAPRDVEVTRYWSLPAPRQAQLDDATLREQVATLLADAVGIRMRSDVPMGAFLSGGIDSSLVVALMQSQSSQPVRTFSIGFAADEFDESRHAEVVAQHLGTRHERMVVEPQDALDVIPRLPHIYDEPFADSSQVPTVLLAQLTRRHVTVALSGDGGDEVFGGYARYFTYRSLWPRLRRLPLALRRPAAGMLRALPPALWSRVAGASSSPLLRNVNPRRVRTLATSMQARDGHDFYRRLVSFWHDGVPLRAGTLPANPFIDGRNLERDYVDAVAGMCQLDMGSYLPDDILAKVDRATMAASLEGRIPFLDHRLVELAATLPEGMKVQAGIGKRVVRDLLARHLPVAMFDRPKQGFAVPVEQWLRGPLRPWAEATLFDRSTAIGELLDFAPIRAAWRQHLDGSARTEDLWAVLMLQAWAIEWRPT